MNNDFPYPGPVMLDVLGTELTTDDRDVLSHPLVGGVILFARNFASCAQLADLTAAIRTVRTPPLLIAVDHEGGRVQRFREGFTRLPPMRQLGHLWDQDKERALSTAQAAGFVLASELRAHGVDLSFTPVLDLDYGHSTVIGDRAFHRKPEAVIKLASALLDGLAQAGMVGVGKHFPGHGFVAADSHLAIPVDERNIVELAGSDLAPFHALSSKLGGVMPAHVIYDQVDRGRPAGFSSYWLKQVLRSDLGFKGAIFSDDLSMAGAGVVGGIIERAQAAWSAGCDVLLVCNDRDATHTLLDNWQPVLRAPSGQRWAKLTPAIPVPSLDAPEYQSSLAQVLALTV